MLGLGIRKAIKRGIQRLVGGEEAPAPKAPRPERPKAPFADGDTEPHVHGPAFVHSHDHGHEHDHDHSLDVQPEPIPAAVDPRPAPEPEEVAVVAAAEPAEAHPLDEEVVTEAHAEDAEATLPDDFVGMPLTEAAVQHVLDDMVRPALQADGGDIALVKVEDNDVYVKLVGSCSTCPSSIATMKLGVERLLQEEFPEMNRLIQIDEAQA